MKKEIGSVMEKAEVGNGERGRAVPAPGESKEQEQGAKSKEVGAAVAPTIRATLRDLELVILEGSKTNPRKEFSKEGLEELALSIREQGIVQPLIVRTLARGPQGDKTGEVKYEVVAGERRLRAARMAGLKAAPCLIREMSDGDVLEVQYIENLQRQDLSALEEAEGFKRLIDSGRYTAESLATKLGKSRGHVFNRLRLARASKAVREAVVSGMPQTLGNLVCQLPTEGLQEKFMRDIGDVDGWASFRDAQDVLERHYSRVIKPEHFDGADAKLHAKAGACTGCPKRSGNLPGFDGKNANVCTDVECYEEKCRLAKVAREGEALAAAGKVLAEEQAKGFKVLSVEESRRVMMTGDYINYGQPWVKLNDVHPLDKKGRTYKELLGKNATDFVTVALSRDDKPVKLLPKAGLERLLSESGHKFVDEQAEMQKRNRENLKKSQEERDRMDREYEARAEKARKEEEREEWMVRHAVGPLVAGLEKSLKDESGLWALLAQDYFDSMDASAPLKRRGWDGSKGLGVLLKGCKEGVLRGFALEMFVSDYDGYDVDKCELVARAAGVDWGKLMKGARAEWDIQQQATKTTKVEAGKGKNAEPAKGGKSSKVKGKRK